MFKNTCNKEIIKWLSFSSFEWFTLDIFVSSVYQVSHDPDVWFAMSV